MLIVLLVMLLMAIGIYLVAGKKILTTTQLNRFNFKEPCNRYTEDTGYQVCNGYIAINNGGLFGVGLGNSTQKYLYLPEAHTDFIFPIVIEELGVITGILVILMYIFILVFLLNILRYLLPFFTFCKFFYQYCLPKYSFLEKKRYICIEIICL